MLLFSGFDRCRSSGLFLGCVKSADERCCMTAQYDWPQKHHLVFACDLRFNDDLIISSASVRAYILVLA